MYIAAADTGVVYSNEDIAGVFDGGSRSFFELDIEWFVEDEGEILWIVR